MGIKGATVLCTHRSFDLVNGVVIDSMHCVFLGVIGKTLMTFWYGVAHRSKPFNIRRKV